ncbi:MAG: hypothetical protein K6C14_01575 [Eubacterium sp.]|nr:hypothetical protein [Eubacterium sp.]
MNKKKNSVFLRRVINNDKSLMAFVLILAVIVWIITSLNIGTDETRTFTVDVPISLSDSLSEQVGMKYYTLKDSVEMRVTVSGAKYIVGQVTADDLKIVFDTSNVNRAGEQSVPILVSNKSKNKDFTVTSTYPASVDAYFDVEETKTFDLELNYDKNAVADGYFFGEPLLSDDKVVIIGPTTYVDKIESVDVDINFDESSKLTEPYNDECTLNLNGSGIEQGYLSVVSESDNSASLKTVSVTLPVLKETVLPVEVAFDNVPSVLKKNDYKVSYSVSSIKAGVLESAEVKSAVVGRISFNEITLGTNSFNFSLADAQGFTPVKGTPESVNVKVTLDDKKYEKTVVGINKDNIEIVGGSGNEEVKELSKTTAIIIAPKGTKISASDLKIKCDISEKRDNGEYPLEMSVNSKSAWVYGEYTANV